MWKYVIWVMGVLGILTGVLAVNGESDSLRGAGVTGVSIGLPPPHPSCMRSKTCSPPKARDQAFASTQAGGR